MDFQLVETGNGGDFNRVGNDIGVVFGFANMPYLAMFGGNVGASTGERIEGEQDFSYWGNSEIFNESESIQLNSLTEITLMNTPLNSAGLLAIQTAVDTDLEFMQAFADVTTAVTIPTVNTVQIDILLIEPNNQTRQEFRYIWDATKREVIAPYETVAPRTITKQNAVLQNVLQIRL